MGRESQKGVSTAVAESKLKERCVNNRARRFDFQGLLSQADVPQGEIPQRRLVQTGETVIHGILKLSILLSH
jgi:hypothetical protein